MFITKAPAKVFNIAKAHTPRTTTLEVNLQQQDSKMPYRKAGISVASAYIILTTILAVLAVITHTA